MVDEKTAETKKREPRFIPQKPGEKDKLGYELVEKQGNKAILKTPKSKFAVYENPWEAKGEKCLLAPVKTIEEAQYFLKNGKKMEKPVPEKKEKKEKKAEKPDKTPAKAAK